MATRRGSTTTPRRKRVWARQRNVLGAIASGVPQQIDLLGGMKLGVGGAWPLGITVGPVLLSACAVRRTSTTLAASEAVVMGVNVASNVIDAVDQDPSVFPMLDWQYWQALNTPDTTATATQFSDKDTLTSRSMRKMGEVGQNLWLVAGTQDTGTFQLHVWSSVLVILP